ncbi:MAG: hypothetical protein HKL99_10890 [Burkholderiales bacterium]|nr:hypothetical protein [Burkholderiales bacterium]
MAKISSEGFRAPAPFQGLNVNFCKNPKCDNFGVPETAHRSRRAPGTEAAPGSYSLVAAGRGKPLLKCGLCGEHLPMRSNQGIHEELMRVMSYLLDSTEPACPNEACSLHTVPLSLAGEMYVQRGKTAAGTQRYRCNACAKTFSGPGKSTKKHRLPHKNREVFALLISKVPLRRMAWLTQMDRKSLYGKLDFIYQQCLRFAGDRERRLLHGMELPKLYLATDRQTLAVNWSNRKDRRNITLQSIATADLTSGYVFGADLNFDPSLDLETVNNEALEIGDVEKPQPYRRYARLWLRADYEAAVAEAQARKDAKAPKRRGAFATDPLAETITQTYADAAAREDVEEVVILESDQTLPKTGVEVRDQYTVYAHFLMLERLIGHAPKVRVYMDLDSGFRAAFMAAFRQQISERRADGWFVRIMKESTIDQKKAMVLKAKKRIDEAMVNVNDEKTTQRDVEILLTLAEMERMAKLGKWDDRWLTHPVPNMAEPDKRVCWLTDIDQAETDHDRREDQLRHHARLYLRASLHAVDRFFMRVRRSLTLAERPYATASSDRRMWHGYSAYQPRNLAMVLTIFKVAHNYCLVDDSGETPAMRLGLAKGPVALEDVLYFSG